MTILHLKNIYAGKEIYVFGSGSSLDYIPVSYFDDKICIATNRVGFVYKLKNYWLCGHHYDANKYREIGCTAPMVLPDRDINNLLMPPIHDKDNIFRFPASKQHYQFFSVKDHFPNDDSKLVIGSTGFHTSLHLAQYMGAKTIIIVGFDQGFLDGKNNFESYTKDRLPTELSFKVWEMHTRDVVKKIRELGCNVFSLNPFMNWNLEGHHFSGHDFIHESGISL